MCVLAIRRLCKYHGTKGMYMHCYRKRLGDMMSVKVEVLLGNEVMVAIELFHVRQFLGRGSGSSCLAGVQATVQ